ncbi:MAG TPA: 5'-nucleotidase C-terminal domain-containing protein [Gemmatimonadales bacterium]
MRSPLGAAAILGAALLSADTAAAQRPDFTPAVTVIQLNDVYRIDPVADGREGGLGRIVTLVERTKRETRAPVMVLHAGDMIAPSLESRYFAGLQMIDALDYLHERAPVLAVPGNHEFDERSPEMFAGAVRESAFGWLAANLQVATGDSAVDRRISADTLLDVNGVRLGVFALGMIDSPRGYVSEDTAVVRIAEERLRRLEQAGADVMVALTHLDMADDRRVAALRARHPKLVWVAGGHEHFLQQDPLTDSTALVTKGDANARRVWRVSLGVRGDGTPAVAAEEVAVDTTIALDPGYQRAVADRWRAELAERVPLLDQRIGTAAVVLDGREHVVRDHESNWGNFLADRMRTAFPDVPADVAVLNGGAIRIDDEFSGAIRWEHIARTFGFPTRVALVWLRGKDLEQYVLEHAVSGGRGEGRFLQVSGLRFVLDRSRAPGDRVSDVELRHADEWVPLEPEKVYVVAVPDYLYGGGDGYHFKDRAIMTIPPGPDLRLIAFDAILAAYSRGEAIGAPVEGRIVERE